MKNFVQYDSSGRDIGLFHRVEGPEDYDKRVAGRSFPLADPDGDYAAMKVGESVRFSGTTTLKRVA